MKTNVSYTGYIAALLLVLSTVFKINHLPGTNVVMILAGGFLSIYLPVFILDRLREGAGGKSLMMHWVAAISAALINLAIVFKIQHWAGASPIMIMGILGFSLGYMPMLLVYKLRTDATKNRIIYYAGFFGISIFFLGVLFKIMHWVLAIEFMAAGGAVLFFLYFPMYMASAAISAEEKNAYLRRTFFNIIIGGLVVTLLVGVLERVAKEDPEKMQTSVLHNNPLITNLKEQ
jgi:hypothetical protein